MKIYKDKLFRILTILLLLLNSLGVFAQKDRSVNSSSQAVSNFQKSIDSIGLLTQDSVRIQTTKLDSVSERISNIADSLHIDKLSAGFKLKLDTLKGKVSNPVNSIGGKIADIRRKADNANDSIRVQLNKLDDRVEGVGMPIQNKSDSIQQNVRSSITDTERKAEAKINSITDKQIDLPGGEKIGLSNVDMSDASLPGIDKQVPDANLSLPVPKTELPTEFPKIETPSLQSHDLKAKLPDLEIPDVKQIERVNELSGEAGKITDKLSELEKAGDDLENLKETAPEKLENFPEEAEKKLEDVAEVTALKGEIAKTTEERVKYEAMIQKYRDKKLLQDEIKRKAASVMNDQLGTQAKKIEAGQKKLAQSKKGLSNIKSVRDVFKRRSDELLKKKFHQRIVPGITWQIYNKDIVAIDFGLQAGYRISPRFTAGAGFVYRAGLSDKFDTYIKGLKTYGGRVYGELGIVKGLFAHGEFEFLTVDPLLNGKTEPISKNVSGSYFGLGKRFKISRNFRGNIQGLYRVEYNGELPSVNKVTARFGVEYIFRKAKKKLVIPKLK